MYIALAIVSYILVSIFYINMHKGLDDLRAALVYLFFGPIFFFFEFWKLMAQTVGKIFRIWDKWSLS